MQFDVPIPLRESVEDLRLPRTEAMFSSVDFFITVLVVVTELERGIRALHLNRKFLGRKVLEKRRDYHLFDYCCTVREYRIVRGSRVLEFTGYWKEWCSGR